jgi:DNA-binding MarR family transcriptional regulator
MMRPDDPRLRDFYDLPGHIFRRAWQRQVAIFDREMGPLGITGAQYVALSAVKIQPGMEQRELSAVIFFDAATTGGIVKRLEAMGVLRRQPSGRSRRGRALYLTAQGEALLAEAAPAIARVSAALLANLTPEEGRTMLALVSKAAGLTNSYYPPDGGEP